MGLWSEAMRTRIKLAEGSIQGIAEIPDDVKLMYRTVWEMPMRSLIDMAADRGAYIDQSQSLNLFAESPNIGRLSSMYMYAWKKGIKTTYYLRSLGATQIEKSTTDVNRRGVQPRWMKNKSASGNIQVDREEKFEQKKKPIACSMEEGCESCQ